MSAHRINDITGREFGRLLVTSFHSRDKNYNQKYNCKCSCGSIAVVSYGALTSGSTKSCGCLQRERTSAAKTTHGKYFDENGNRSKLSRIWSAMKERCFNKNRKFFSHYGGRGITVCDEWLEFAPFHEWAMSNGYVEGLTVERIDNDLGYSPLNCKIATRKEQARNKRNTVFLSHEGKTMKLVEWAELKGVRQSMIRLRIKRGWSHGDAISTPSSNRRKSI